MFWVMYQRQHPKMAGLLAETCWFLVHFIYLINAPNMEQIKKKLIGSCLTKMKNGLMNVTGLYKQGEEIHY
jgi:hypothetical protein